MSVRDKAQLQLERALTRATEGADGAIACHLSALDDDDLHLLKDSQRVRDATVTLWLAMSERLGFPVRAIPSEVLETFVELLTTECALEAQRRAGGMGFYPPSVAGSMAGYLRNGQTGLQQAMEQFSVLSDYSVSRLSERNID